MPPSTPTPPHPPSLLPGDRTSVKARTHLTTIQAWPDPWKQNPWVPLAAGDECHNGARRSGGGGGGMVGSSIRPQGTATADPRDRMGQGGWKTSTWSSPRPQRRLFWPPEHLPSPETLPRGVLPPFQTPLAHPLSPCLRRGMGRRVQGAAPRPENRGVNRAEAWSSVASFERGGGGGVERSLGSCHRMVSAFSERREARC